MVDISKIIINVDAGHGSNTAGKRTAPFTKDVDINKDGKIDIKKGEQYREHYANVMVAYKLYNKLKDRGFGVYKTGWNDSNAKDDVDTSIVKRQKAVKENGCDISISCHFNAYGDGKTFNNAEGFGVYVHSNKANRTDSDKLASIIVKHLSSGTKQKNRGVSTGAFGMCNAKTMKTKAAVIVEFAFMTNKREAQELMANEAYCEECAEEVYKAVCDYYNVEYTVKKKEEHKKETKIYRVQVGAYSKKSNADNMAKSLKKDGYDYFVTKPDKLYRVQVGAFSVKKNAENLAKELKKKGYDTIVV